LPSYLCQRMGCGDTQTSEAHVFIDYKHIYRLYLCDKHKTELESL
jgi:hypothetical protein